MAYPDEFARAKKVARAKIAFYIHLTAYLAVNALLIGINLVTSTQYLWFKWPLLGWGIGILAHGFVTFALVKGPGIARGMIEREMKKSSLKGPQA